MTLRQRIAADVQADEQVGFQLFYRYFETVDHAFDAAVDIDQENFFVVNCGHLRFSEQHSVVGLTFAVRHPRGGMKLTNFAHFTQLARSGNWIVNVPFPRKPTEDEF